MTWIKLGMVWKVSIIQQKPDKSEVQKVLISVDKVRNFQNYYIRKYFEQQVDTFCYNRVP
jgi:hypothetical protein